MWQNIWRVSFWRLCVASGASSNTTICYGIHTPTHTPTHTSKTGFEVSQRERVSVVIFALCPDTTFAERGRLVLQQGQKAPKARMCSFREKNIHQRKEESPRWCARAHIHTHARRVYSPTVRAEFDILHSGDLRSASKGAQICSS